MSFMTDNLSRPAYLVFPPDSNMIYLASNTPSAPLLCWQSNGGNVFVVAWGDDARARDCLQATSSYSLKEGQLTGWRGLMGFQFFGHSAHEIANVIRKSCFANEKKVEAAYSEISDYSLRWCFLQNSERSIVLCRHSVDSAKSVEEPVGEGAIYFEHCPLA